MSDFLSKPTRPRQTKQEFGSPALVMYDGQHFLIELLCWTTGTVGLHRHGFSGAFHLLLGSSLHSTFDFQPVHRVSSRFLIGNLERTATELLEPGATRTIRAIELIHSNFHLETPSVTVVVRTRFEAEAKPQYAYEPPYLAIDPFYDDAVALRHRETLRFLEEVRLPSYRKVFADYVSNRNLESCYEALRIAFADEAFFAELLPFARKAHGPLVDLFSAVLREQRRRNNLIAKRGQIANLDHRFFLGLLLNLDHSEEIQRMVRARYRGAPGDTIMRFIRELSVSMAGEPGFDLKLSDGNSEVFRCLLAGCTLAQTLRELAKEYGTSEVRKQRAAIADLYEALRSSDIYRPLFQHDPRARVKHPSIRP